jgi:hypothetical protein
VVGVEAGGTEALRAHLRERLPAYMVPVLIVSLPALPRNANGKLDRSRLPEPQEAPSADHFSTPIEDLIAGIWAAVLGVPGPGPNQDFFALGGAIPCGPPRS